MRTDYLKGIDQGCYDAADPKRNRDGLVFGRHVWIACPKCESQRWRRAGFSLEGLQRWRCISCGKRITGHQYQDGSFYQELPFGLNRKGASKAEEVGRLLLAGFSLRHIERLTGVNKRTIRKILDALEDWVSVDSPEKVPFRCACGTPIRDHKGNCKIRYLHQIERQEWMRSWRQKEKSAA